MQLSRWSLVEFGRLAGHAGSGSAQIHHDNLRYENPPSDGLLRMNLRAELRIRVGMSMGPARVAEEGGRGRKGVVAHLTATIWREKSEGGGGEGGCLEKVLHSPLLPSPFLCDGPGADLW